MLAGRRRTSPPLGGVLLFEVEGGPHVIDRDLKVVGDLVGLLARTGKTQDGRRRDAGPVDARRSGLDLGVKKDPIARSPPGSR